MPRWGGKEDVPFISIGDDYGDIVHGIFLEPENWNGKLVQGVSDIKSLDEVVAAFERGKLVYIPRPSRHWLTMLATGKKARFEEVTKWQDLEVYGIRALETVKLMFGFCQESGGRYYGDITEAGSASELKKRVNEACENPNGQGKLANLEGFFKREFGGK
jgi:hypothetical protein